MRLLFAAAAAALTLAACNQPAEAPATTEAPPVEVQAPSGEYALDPHHSTVTVRAQHFGLARYTLRFNKVSGTLNFNAENPAQSTIQASIDVTSLDTPYTGERDFDAELQNSSWLDSANFPTATFASTAVEQTGPNTAARVTGNLTLHGQTHPVTFDVTYTGSHSPHPFGMQISSIGFSARGVIQRSQFGVNELLPRAGNDGVSDQVELVIEAEFTRPIESAPVPGNSTREPVN